MDEKTKALCDELLLIIMIIYKEQEKGIKFHSLYPVFNYGFGTISDLLKILVKDGYINVIFNLDEQPEDYPDEFLPEEEQIKKLHLCNHDTTYIFPTSKGLELVKENLRQAVAENREIKFTGLLRPIK
ncbi:MAG TPA: hypothetical protein PLE33_04585 [Candidatus Cloacimonas sp.]|nr:hypothetical protein [Candidatus Cloacimonas sp.]HPS60519.1 hypothetical protein [Candidatus Cloacimonas sp.]